MSAGNILKSSKKRNFAEMSSTTVPDSNTAANTDTASRQPKKSKPNPSETKNHIKVAVRLRPLLGNEKPLTEVFCNRRKSQIGVVIPRNRGKDGTKLYTYDTVFESNTKQQQLFDTSISPIIDDVLSGYNCTVFAYGQTGSGKTFTMEGTRFTDPNGYTETQHSNNDGVIPRAIKAIFEQLEASDMDYTVLVSHMEIYNEDLEDLLSDEPPETKKKLIIYKDDGKHGTISARGSGVVVQGLEEVSVTSPQVIFDILAKSSRKRKQGCTNLNEHSSRSHSIFTVILRMKETQGTEEYVKTGTLNLVDLAGSESVGRSGAVDQRAKEAGHINTSLLTLGRVISALSSGTSRHIPYRESKLTRILQESLGGRNKTLLIATICPNSPLEQTVSTLDYALRTKNIMNKPEINKEITQKKYVKELQSMISNYKKQISALRTEKGVILPPEQYESMEASLKENKTQISMLTSALESKTNDFEEISELFDTTQSQLTISRQHTRKLEQDLCKLSDELSATMHQLNGQKYVVSQYASSHSQLHSQATSIKSTLKCTVTHRDSLFDRIDVRRALESANVGQWSDTHKTVSTMLVDLKLAFGSFGRNQQLQMQQTMDAMSQLRHNCTDLQNMTGQLCATHSDTLDTQLEAMRDTTTDFLCDTHTSQLNDLSTAISQSKTESIQSCAHFTDEISKPIITQMANHISQLSKQLTDITESVNKHMSIESESLESLYNNVSQSMDTISKSFSQQSLKQESMIAVWKKSELDRIETEKTSALRLVTQLFNQMSGRHISQCEKHCQSMSDLQSETRSIFDTNTNQLLSSLKSDKTQMDVVSQKDHDHFTSQMSNAQSDTVSIANTVIPKWQSQINNGIAAIQKKHITSDDSHSQMTQKTLESVSAFASNHTNTCDALQKSQKQCVAQLNSLSSSITKHDSSIADHCITVETSQKQCNESTQNVSSDMTTIQSEVDSFEISRYSTTGDTPKKAKVSYPTAFVQNASVDNLLQQFNTANKSKSVSTDKENMPNHTNIGQIPKELEIEFYDDELGIRIYAGDASMNAFVKECTSDVRVKASAQLITIDGITVIDKSFSYIRTALTTKQRPISIQFRNPDWLVDETDEDVSMQPLETPLKKPTTAVAAATDNTSVAKTSMQQPLETPMKKPNTMAAATDNTAVSKVSTLRKSIPTPRTGLNRKVLSALTVTENDQDDSIPKIEDLSCV